jgi:hypothetical protein
MTFRVFLLEQVRTVGKDLPDLLLKQLKLALAQSSRRADALYSLRPLLRLSTLDTEVAKKLDASVWNAGTWLAALKNPRERCS